MSASPALEPNVSAHSELARPDMPDTVFDGRLGDICQTKLGRFPVAYSWLAVLAAGSVFVPRSNSYLKPNLFVALVGPFGTGKTDAAECAFRAVGLDFPLLMKAKYGSAEGMIESLQDIEPDASRLLFPDELSHLLEKAAIDRSSFRQILTTAFYDYRQEGGTKGRAWKMDCRLSLLGGVIEDEFGEVFGAASTGGLYDRFLFGLCPSPASYSHRPFEESPISLNPFNTEIDAEVWEVRDSWRAAGISGRIPELALRTAYICACVDGRPKLRAEDLGPAEALAEYQQRARVVLAPNHGENPDARCAIKINAHLASRRLGEWVHRRELERAINGSRFGPGVFNRCLNNLAFNKEIEVGPEGNLVRLVTVQAE